MQRFLWKYLDDTLDVFACHGIGGMAGAFQTGLFATLDANPAGANGAFYGRPILLAYQLAAIGSAIAWSAGLTAGICLILKYTIGLRVEAEVETKGLDSEVHGQDTRSEV